MPDSLSVRVFRFDPGTDRVPRYETHAVPHTPDMRVLDALNHIYEHSGAPLAHRWYCGTKKCGECAVTVNGRSILSCWEAAADGMTCEPLTNFPIIRDLAVDTAPVEARIVGMGLSLNRANPPPFPEKLDPVRMDPANRLAKCIECHVCSAAVPARELTSDGPVLPGGVGAAGLVRFARFALDPRDASDRGEVAARERLDEVRGSDELSRICPQGIDIVRDAIIPLRERLTRGQQEAVIESSGASAFFMAPSWSAFVRLSDERKATMKASGAIEAMEIPGMSEAYSFR